MNSATVPRASPHIFGCSVIGPLHVRMGFPCQDACAFETISSGSGVIAVADGLGSASKSELGAHVATGAVVRATKELLVTNNSGVPPSEIACNAVSSARSALTATSAQEQCSIHDLACTIIVVVFREGKLAIAHIGDGAVVAQTDQGLELLSGPGESEYTNEVTPLTTEEWESQLRLVAFENPIQSFAVFTDGCQRAAFQKSDGNLKPFAGFFGPIFCYAQEVSDVAEATRDIESLLASTKLCENSEDDKTLVIACC